MLDQCLSSVIDNGTTFNQHWFSASCWLTTNSRDPANTRYWPNVVLMLARLLQRRHSIKTTLPRCQCFVLAGYVTLLPHSQNQVSAYFTCVQILSFERAVTNKKETVTSAKRKYVIDLQVSKYGLLAALCRKSQLKSSKCLFYQGADNAFWFCTGRTDVKRKLTTDICSESQWGGNWNKN